MTRVPHAVVGGGVGAGVVPQCVAYCHCNLRHDLPETPLCVAHPGIGANVAMARTSIDTEHLLRVLGVNVIISVCTIIMMVFNPAMPFRDAFLAAYAATTILTLVTFMETNITHGAQTAGASDESDESDEADDADESDDDTAARESASEAARMASAADGELCRFVAMMDGVHELLVQMATTRDRIKSTAGPADDACQHACDAMRDTVYFVACSLRSVVSVLVDELEYGHPDQMAKQARHVAALDADALRACAERYFRQRAAQKARIARAKTLLDAIEIPALARG